MKPATTIPATKSSFAFQVLSAVNVKQPQGYYTMEQIASELGKGPSSAHKIIVGLVKRGIVDRKKWTRLNDDLGSRTTYVYKVKK